MNKNSLLFIEIQYFPVVNWFKYSYHRKYIILRSYEVYQKMSFRNRMIICGSNGLINLSVPIEKGRNQKVPFKEVKISYIENWQLNHWRSIVSCYGKSPFFYYYQHELQKLFSKKHSFLFDLNLSILDWLKVVVKLPPHIIIAEENPVISNEIEIANLTNKWLPKNFQSDLPVIKYSQVFEDKIGFQLNVSILDMLFNTGTEISNLLSSHEE
jgi:hypothetical protein